jgi:nicotinamide mononucleotide transporter
MSRLEVAANLVNLISIFLAARNHILTWMTGILGCFLFGLLFYDSRLYAEVSLQVFFIGTSFIGWSRWRQDEFGQERAVSRVPLRRLWIYVFAGCLGAVAYGTLLRIWTNASYPFVDSMVLAFSVIAQLLLMNRKMENWHFWILVNLISVPLYLVKELYLTAGVYALFLINAVLGILCWRRSLKSEAV